MYFAADLEREVIVNEHGDTFSRNQFEYIMEINDHKIDMTLMVQRLVRMDHDFVALKKFYDEN